MAPRKQRRHRRGPSRRSRFNLPPVEVNENAAIPVWPEEASRLTVGKTWLGFLLFPMYLGPVLAYMLCAMISSAALCVISTSDLLEWRVTGYIVFVLAYYCQYKLPHRILRLAYFMRFTYVLQFYYQVPTPEEIKILQEHLGFHRSVNMERSEWTNLRRVRTETWSTLNIVKLFQNYMFRDADYQATVLSLKLRKSPYRISLVACMGMQYYLYFPCCRDTLIFFQTWSAWLMLNIQNTDVMGAL